MLTSTFVSFNAAAFFGMTPPNRNRCHQQRIPGGGRIWNRACCFVRRLLWLGLLATALHACTTRMPEPPLPQEAFVHPPNIEVDPKTGVHSVEIDVLAFNVAALPWPILSDRTKALRLIGAEFAAMRERGEEPDIVLIQEGFRRSTKDMITASGYPNWVRGPLTGDRVANFSARAPDSFIQERSFWKGERIGKVMNGGLYVLSNWPILVKGSLAFYRNECAGFDCGSNKGMLGVNIEVPGMPGYLQVVTTHLNSRGASGVPDERSLIAHNLQMDHLHETIVEHWTGDHPMIFGGDFNMARSPERLQYAIRPVGEAGQSAEVAELQEYMEIVQHYCTIVVTDCDVRMSYDSDSPWLDTQDWQGWVPGVDVKVRAIMVDALFDQPHPEAPKIKDRKTLSDHDGARLVSCYLDSSSKVKTDIHLGQVKTNE